MLATVLVAADHVIDLVKETVTKLEAETGSQSVFRGIEPVFESMRVVVSLGRQSASMFYMSLKLCDFVVVSCSSRIESSQRRH